MDEIEQVCYLELSQEEQVASREMTMTRPAAQATQLSKARCSTMKDALLTSGFPIAIALGHMQEWGGV